MTHFQTYPFGKVERALESLRNIADKERSMGSPGSGPPGVVFKPLWFDRSKHGLVSHREWSSIHWQGFLQPWYGFWWMTINQSIDPSICIYIYILTYNIHIYIYIYMYISYIYIYISYIYIWDIYISSMRYIYIIYIYIYYIIYILYTRAMIEPYKLDEKHSWAWASSCRYIGSPSSRSSHVLIWVQCGSSSGTGGCGNRFCLQLNSSFPCGKAIGVSRYFLRLAWVWHDSLKVARLNLAAISMGIPMETIIYRCCPDSHFCHDFSNLYLYLVILSRGHMLVAACGCCWLLLAASCCLLLAACCLMPAEKYNRSLRYVKKWKGSCSRFWEMWCRFRYPVVAIPCRKSLWKHRISRNIPLAFHAGKPYEDIELAEIFD